MKDLLRSGHFWIATGLCALFWATTRLLHTEDTLILTNSLMFAGSLTVSVAYFPYFWEAVRNRGPRRSRNVRIGIWYAWTFGMFWRIHSIIWLKAGTPAFFIQNDLIAFWQAGVFLGSMYHVTSPGAVGGERGERIPSLKWIAAALVIGIAGFMAVFLATKEIDLTWMVERLRPYLPGADEY